MVVLYRRSSSWCVACPVNFRKVHKGYVGDLLFWDILLGLSERVNGGPIGRKWGWTIIMSGEVVVYPAMLV